MTAFVEAVLAVVPLAWREGTLRLILMFRDFRRRLSVNSNACADMKQFVC